MQPKKPGLINMKSAAAWLSAFAVAYAGAWLCDAIYAIKETKPPIELDANAPEMIVCGRTYALNVVSNELALTLPQERLVRYRLALTAEGEPSDVLAFTGLEPGSNGVIRLRLEEEQLRRHAGTNLLTLAVDEANVVAHRRSVVIKAKDRADNWEVAADGLLPGGRYCLSIDNLLPTKKRPNEVEVALYEAGAKRICARRRFNILRLRRANGDAWEFDVPKAKGRYQLIAYAGVSGACNGIGMVYKSVAVRLLSQREDGK